MKVRPYYKRILIKLSGEVLKGGGELGIDPGVMRSLAEEIAGPSEVGVETALVIGGGNLIRGIEAADYGIERVTADHIGILTTVINGLVFRDVMEKMGIPVSMYAAFPINEIVAPYMRAHAIRDLKEKKVVIFVGGIGSPFFTTDTTASLRALEIGAEIILKATKVDGVYDSDPLENPAAVRFDQISYQEVLKRKLRVMDSTAISLCMDNQLPLVVFNIGIRGSVKKIVHGEKEGTFIGQVNQ